MRTFLILILILSSCYVKAQAIIIEQEFNSGTTQPAGWIFSSIGSSLNSNSNYGKTQPSIVMDATGDQITSSTFVAGTANTLSFWAQSSGGTPTASDLISAEYFNGSWNSCSPASFTFNTTARIYEASFPITATRVRITYTKVTAGVNAAIDDFTILNKSGSCTTTDFLWFTSITYNSCNANTCEGTDEFLTFQNGSSALNLSDLEITVPGVGAGPEGTTFCGSSVGPCDEFFTTNAAYVASLNAVAGCGGFFLSPPGNIIPANGRVIVFMGNPPTTTINFSTLCGSGGNYYCVFVSNTTNCTGRYSNSSTSLRFTTIRNRSTGCSVERSFIASNGGSNDGDIVAFDPPGTPTYISNPGCTGFVILPIELLYFKGNAEKEQIDLTWKVAGELNTSAYMIDKSLDGINWNRVAIVQPKGEQTHDIIYSTKDEQPLKGINYYRLQNADYNGEIFSHPVIFVEYKDQGDQFRFIQTEETLKIVCHPALNNSTLLVKDITGREIQRLPVNQQGEAFLSKKEIQKGIYIFGSLEYPITGYCKALIY